MKKTIISGLLAAILSVPVYADTANYIISNEYVKAGINGTTGTLGSGGNTNPGLQYDNTGAGSFNSAYDYLTPGSPYEGWAVRIDNATGTRLKLYGNNNAGFQMDGNTTLAGAWLATPTASSGVWSSTAAPEFDIKHTYSLPSGQKYIDITTRIDAKQAMPNLYFGRYIDPDAVAAPGDSSATDNVRGYGIIPKTNVVFSEATVSRYALGLYSAKPTGVNTSIQGWTSDPKNYYNNVGGYDVGNGDDTIGIAFYNSNIAVGDILTYNYAYIFGPSAFGAASTAISGGAGGGTAGTSSFGTLTDVGSATSAATTSPAPTTPTTPSTPTVTGTTTTNTSTYSDTVGTAVTTSVVGTAVVSRNGLESVSTQTTTQTTYTPITRTTTTTPVTTTTYSDSTTTTSSGTPVVTTSDVSTTSVAATTTTVTESIRNDLPVITASLAHHEASEGSGKQTISRETTTNVTTPLNRATRVAVVTDGVTTSDATTNELFNNVDTSIANDSFSGRIDQMAYLNTLNQQLDRSLNMDAFRQDGVSRDDITMYINASGSKSNMGDGYNAKNQIYGLGVEKAVTSDWRLGVQYNRVTTTMNGVDSTTGQDKNHVGLFSILRVEDFKVVNNLGYSDNTIRSNRTIQGINFNNSHNTTGNDLWLNNRVYTPDLEGFRPFVGVTVGRATVNGYTEAGSIQSARTVGKQVDNYSYGEGGVRYEKSIDNFRLMGEIGQSTDSYTTGSLTVGYKPTKDGMIALTGTTQTGNNVTTNTVSLRGIIKF